MKDTVENLLNKTPTLSYGLRYRVVSVKTIEFQFVIF